MTEQIPPFGIHHIALACNDLEVQAEFYTSLGFVILSKQVGEEGLRSIWLDCGGSILMLERASLQPRNEKKARPFHEKEAGVHLLAFRIDSHAAVVWREFLEERKLLVDESDYTLYLYDKEHNRIGLCSYPDQLRRRPD